VTGRLQLAGRAGWGLADQVLSSLTNFGLGILVARNVSREDFGGFSLAFSTFLVILNVSRAVSTEPLLIRYSAISVEAWREGAKAAAGASLATGALGAAVCLLVAALTQGSVQSAYLVLAIVLPGLLLQDCWRFALIARGAPRLTFLVDLAWGIALVPLFLFVELQGGGVTVVAPLLAWGASAAFSAVIGAYLAGILPRPNLAPTWVRQQRDLVPRFVAEAITGSGAAQVVILAVGALVGLAGAGAIRAGQLLLGPMQVMFMAVTLIAVPEAVRILRGGLSQLVRACVLLAAVMSATVVAWAVLLLMLPESLGTSLLGPTWTGAREVILPLGFALAALAASSGAGIGLRAMADARGSLRARLVDSSANVVAGTAGAALGGATGAAWGLAIGAVCGTLAYWTMFRLSRRTWAIRAALAPSPLPEQP
jgi:O-antigen/teichoic acid export membrane protein